MNEGLSTVPKFRGPEAKAKHFSSYVLRLRKLMKKATRQRPHVWQFHPMECERPPIRLRVKRKPMAE